MNLNDLIARNAELMFRPGMPGVEEALYVPVVGSQYPIPVIILGMNHFEDFARSRTFAGMIVQVLSRDVGSKVEYRDRFIIRGREWFMGRNGITYDGAGILKINVIENVDDETELPELVVENERSDTL